MPPVSDTLLTDELAPWFVRTAAAVFGALWGSFFNVVIYRWPREISVVFPASHCPACQARIPARHNIPILSYLLLRGRAACCGARLSMRYPLVEVLAAILALAVAERFIVRSPWQVELLPALLVALCFFAFVGGLLVAAFIDMECMEIPDEIALPGAALGLATATFRPWPSAAEIAFGAGVGFLLVQVLFVWGYEKLTGRRGMGEGDAKLLMMIGAFVGWQGVLFSLFAGATQGVIVALGLLMAGRSPTPTGSDDRPSRDATRGIQLAPAEPLDTHEEAPGPRSEPPPRYAGHLKVPFGPFLSLAAIEYLFFGEAVLEVYWGLFR